MIVQTTRTGRCPCAGLGWAHVGLLDRPVVASVMHRGCVVPVARPRRGRPSHLLGEAPRAAGMPALTPFACACFKPNEIPIAAWLLSISLYSLYSLSTLSLYSLSLLSLLSLSLSLSLSLLAFSHACDPPAADFFLRRVLLVRNADASGTRVQLGHSHHGSRGACQPDRVE